MTALEVESVGFAYTSGVGVLDDVSLRVPQGQVVGLLGPNGSGKTTLVQVVLDLLALQEGTVRIAGHRHDTTGARQSSMYLPSDDHLPQFLTGRELLRTVARLYGADLPAVEEVVDRREVGDLFDRLGMRGRLDDLVEDYSHGMRKKTQLIGALAMRRPLTVIDETLNGIDVGSLRWCEKELARLRDEGGAVLLCTHDFALLERIADRVVFLDLGQVVADAPTDDLVREHGSLASLVFDRLDAEGR